MKKDTDLSGKFRINYLLIVSLGYPSDKYPTNGIFEYDQARALAACGHRVIMACLDIRSVRRWRKWGLEHFERDGLEIYCINIPVGAIGDNIQQTFRKLAMKILYAHITAEHGRPQLVHGHFSAYAGFCGKFCHEAHIPFVITEHGSNVNKDGLSAREIEKLNEAYRYADRVISVSRALSERIRQYSGREAICIPNIVDTKLFCSAVAKRQKTHEGPFRFASVGNLIYGKGFDVLLEAFAAVVRDGCAVTLDIVGSGVLEHSLKMQAVELGIGDLVTFHGRQSRERIAEIFVESDGFVLASRSETFGVAYVEAMAAGLPVIATLCGGPEDFVTDAVGVLVPSESPECLMNAMKKMIFDQKKYDSGRISDYAVSNFSPSCIAARLTDVYRAVLHDSVHLMS